MLNIFKGKPKRFISAKQHQDNFSSQTSMAPQTVEQLRGYGVSEDKSLKLEFFFYTNSAEKARKLNTDLVAMGYSSKFGAAANDPKLQVITGWSSPISMATETVVKWTASMCNLGYQHDCEFDGWGTNPQQ